jgi:hypothetical protein
MARGGRRCFPEGALVARTQTAIESYPALAGTLTLQQSACAPYRPETIVRRDPRQVISSSLRRLSCSHRTYEAFKGRQVAFLKQFDRNQILKMSIKRVKRNTGIGLIAVVETHNGNPDSIGMAKVCL